MIERLSIELTNRCGKACAFCYNASGPGGATVWDVDEVVAFVEDCAAHGVLAASFGGGEPLEYAGLHDVLARLRGRIFRSITTNGLLLDATAVRRLVEAAPDKVHVSLHAPERRAEVVRVASQVHMLAAAGVRSGVNLLVARSRLAEARAAAAVLAASGIPADRIVFLPMRGRDTPTPAEMASVAGTPRFQSMSCLAACGRSPRFAAVRWDKTVAWCSYTTARRPLAAPTWHALVGALDGLGLAYCGEPDAA